MIQNYRNYYLKSYKIVGNSIIVELLQKSAIFDVFYRFAMHILKVDLFYRPVNSVPTWFQNFFDATIVIFMKKTFFLVFFSRPPYWIPVPKKLNSGNGFGKSTRENSRISIPRRIVYDSIILYKVRNSKENLGLLGVNGLRPEIISQNHKWLEGLLLRGASPVNR